MKKLLRTARLIFHLIQLSLKASESKKENFFFISITFCHLITGCFEICMKKGEKYLSAACSFKQQYENKYEKRKSSYW